MSRGDLERELTLLSDQHQTRRIRQTVRDIIQCYEGSFPFDRDAVLHHLLGLSETRNLFDLATLHSVLADMQTRGTLSKTPSALLRSAAHATLAQATTDPNITHEISIYSMIYPELMTALTTRSVPSRNMSLHATPVQLQWTLFKIIARLAQQEQFDTIMPMIDSLVHSGSIPESALQNLPASGFAQIVFTILMRCCLNWGWRSRAAYLLLRTPDWDQAKSPAFNDIVREIAGYVLQEEEEPANPRLAVSLMVRIVNSQNAVTISDDNVQHFYALMMKYGFVQEAQAFYDLTRSSSVLAAHRYPPPQGASFIWMLKEAVSGKVNQTMRALVREVVEGNVDVPPLSRAYVVTQASVHGFMTYARTLWTRWEQDVFVTGDAGVNLRLVSLVVNRIAAVKHRAEHSAMTNASRVKTVDPGQDAQPATDLDLPEDVTSSPSEGRRDSPKLSHPGDTVIRQGNAFSFDDQAADYRAFAEHVVETFRRCHEPLERAHHRILNALARLHIMMGDPAEGFAVLKIIRDRNQTPDLRDVNVALSALVHHNPRAGARMLSRMIELGLQPDAASFGTVIHQAALHGDMPLVTSLVVRARQVGVTKLDYKTINTLIRAAISTPHDVDQGQLENVRELVDSLIEANVIPSPQIGVDCVHAALRADDPVTAHRFWQLLVKDKIEFTDYKQRAMRMRIARSIGRHLHAETLSASEANRMLGELGHGARVAAQQQQEQLQQEVQDEDEAQRAEAEAEMEAKDERP
ncbi:hypothetical protein PHLGIDRAFT_308770 [Phlebiopsis gigantea 11061_1 CR5-6]|uniref:Pentacotripeptide-repeat region of PRORP domain-containing protein n=1 Tax=Phlebiopsis gigantea (strain 11061_1 CR5-6) TaxID=745531 RepID=A0A0C3NWD6_PHLG1|nr:hypothetical protein PHLGIDRAFT_308770 [Phlebiopsis gigantea 11061_1 CR5-6]